MDSFAMMAMFGHGNCTWSTGAIVAAVCGGLLGYALTAFILGRLFKKAGIKSWKAWVPIYNLWKLFQIGGTEGVWALLPVIAGISTVVLLLFTNDFRMNYMSGDKLPPDQAAASIILLIVIVLTGLLFVVSYLQVTWNITKKLGKNWVYMLLLLVNLGPSLWLWIMALDKSKWDDSLGRKSLAPDMKKKETVKHKK